MSGGPAVELAAGGAWRFAAPPPATPAALERAWGQFELRLPVQGFVVPAPHCRDEIRLRWVGLTPDAPDRRVRLEQRWSVLERLKALQDGDRSAPSERVELDLRHYVRRRPHGGFELQYCNAFAADPAR